MDTQKGLSFVFLHSQSKLMKAKAKLENKLFVFTLIFVAVTVLPLAWVFANLINDLAHPESFGHQNPWFAYIFSFIVAIIVIFFGSLLVFDFLCDKFVNSFFRQTKFGKLANENFHQFVDWMSSQFNVSVNHLPPSLPNTAPVQIMMSDGYNNFVFEDKNEAMYCLSYIDAERTVLNVSRLKTSSSDNFVLLTEEYDNSFYAETRDLQAFNLLKNNTNLSKDLYAVVSEVKESFISLEDLELSRAQATILISVKQEAEQLSSQFLKVETLADDEFNSLIINTFSLLKEQLDDIRDGVLADAKSNIARRLSLIETGMITA